MRIESQNGNAILCGVILPPGSVKAGQKWISSGGQVVGVDDVREGFVFYNYNTPEGLIGHHCKDNFSFQCRYCLIVTGLELNDWLQAIPQA